MTLDEAIKHCEERAKELREQASIGLDSMDDTIRAERCKECAEEHEQLAEWLNDYKRLLEEQRPQGEWEYNQYDGNANIGNWHCSKCRHLIFGGYSQKPYYSFCPNCGADMRKGDEE